jgi:Kef-type K+ transport system membrane component KefB
VPGSLVGGSSLTATSLGISARVFTDLGRLGALEARTVLGASAVGDVLGLLTLTVVARS